MGMHRGRWPRFMAVIAILALAVSLTPGLSLFASGSGGPAEQGGPLFGPVPTGPTAPPAARMPLPADPTAKRSQLVTVDTALIGTSGRASATNATLTLNLFPDVTLLAVRDSVQPTQSGTGTIWQGHVDGVPNSFVTLVSDQGVVIGHIQMPGASYEIRYRADGIHVIVEIDFRGYPSESNGDEAPEPSTSTPTGGTSAPRAAAADDGSIIDVMVLYSTDAKNGAGGQTAIENAIQTAIADANAAYGASGVVQRLNLVYKGEVTYTETHDSSLDLPALRSGTGISLAGGAGLISDKRDAVKADIVSLILEDIGSSCGLGYLMTNVSTSFATSAFNVVERDCVVGNFSMTHEMGHNMGARHDWAVDSGTTPFAFAHGFTNGTGASGWRTIMAYPDGCGSCPRQRYISNPDALHPGDNLAMGIAEGLTNAADNRKTFNTTRTTVANFRAGGSTGGPTPTATTAVPTNTPTRTPTTGTIVPAPPVAGTLVFLSPPVRVVDTRSASKIGFKPDGTAIAAGPLAAGSTTRFKIGGQTFGGSAIPAGLTGALVNVTSVQGGPTGGFVTLFSADLSTPPTASTVNPGLGINANFATTAVGQTAGNVDSVAIYSVGAVRDVVIDLVGYYRVGGSADAARSAVATPAAGRAAAATGNLKLIPPVRVLDTRPGGNGITTTGFNADGTAVTAAPLTAGQLRRFLLDGKSFGSGGNAVTFPADTAGILAHVTTIQGSGTGGFVSLVPGDATGTPTTSTVNPGTAVAFNTAAVGIPTAGGAGITGTFGLYSTNQLDVAVDIVGYFAASNTLGQAGVVGNPSLITPSRVLDTRANDAAAGIFTTGYQANGTAITAGQIPAGATRNYLLAGKTFAGGAVGIPADVKGVLANVTLVQGAPGGGFLTVFPADLATPPNASTVNPSTAIAASGWVTALSTNPALNPGALSVYSTSDPRDVLIDVVGYYR